MYFIGPFCFWPRKPRGLGQESASPTGQGRVTALASCVHSRQASAWGLYRSSAQGNSPQTQGGKNGTVTSFLFFLSDLLFSRWVTADSLQPHRLQHAKLPCSSLSPGACSNSCPSSQWCHFPGDSDSKESAGSAGEPGSILRSGKSPGEGSGCLLQYSCLENSLDRGVWQATQSMGLHRVGPDWVTNSRSFLAELSFYFEPLANSLQGTEFC